MFNTKRDFKTRFRILKGGKISMVVSAMLVSASISMTDLNAAPAAVVETSAANYVNSGIITNTTEAIGLTTDNENLYGKESLTNDGSITITNNGAGENSTGIYLYGNYGGSIVNAQYATIDVEASDSAVGIEVSTFFNSDSSITLESDSDLIVLSNDDGATGIYISNNGMDDNSTIINYGTIDVDAADGATGIDVSDMDGTSTITNNGTIDVDAGDDAYGIYVTNMYGTSTITNNSLIDVSASDNAVGIYSRYLYDDSSVINNGTIDVDAGGRAVGIYGEYLNDDSSVINDGIIDVAASDSAIGIEIYDMSSDSSITLESDSSLIVSSTQDEATGIEIDSMYYNSTITNNGLIDVESSSNDAFGIYLTDMDGASTITNNGEIQVTASSDNAFGIYVEDGMYDNSTITNNGTIGVISTSDNAFGIYVEELEDNATIINNDTIQVAAGEDAYGIFHEYDMEDATITNSGAINVLSALGYAVGIDTDTMSDSSIILESDSSINVVAYSDLAIGINSIELGESGFGEDVSIIGESSIYNAGTINAQGLYNAGAVGIIATIDSDSTLTITNAENAEIITDANGLSVGIFAVGGYSDSAIDITNHGTISATVNDELHAYGFSAKYVNFGKSANGTLTNSSTGKLYGNLLFAGTVENAGLVSLPSNANGKYSAYVEDFYQTSEGTLEIGLKTTEISGEDTATVEHSQLNVSGGAVFESDSTINVNVHSSSTGESLILGEDGEYRLDDVVVTGEDGLFVGDNIEVTDNSTKLDFELIFDADSINDNESLDLLAVEGGSFQDSTQEGGGQTPAQQVAGLFDDQYDDGDRTPFLEHLDSLNPEETAKLVKKAAPDVAGSGPSAAGFVAKVNAQIVEQRQKGLVGASGDNSGEQMFTEKSFWLKPFGAWGNQNNKDSLSGYDIESYGLGFGIDGTNKDDQQFGIGLFYTKSDVDVNDVDQKADIKSYTVLGYGSAPIIDDKTRLLYQIGYSWQDTETAKDLGVPGVAKADYTAKLATLKLEVMRDYQVNESLLLQPITGLSYSHYSSPSYDESVTNLTIGELSTSNLLLGLGTNIEYRLDSDSKLLGTVNLDYDLQDKDDSISVLSGVGTSVTYNTIDNGRFGYGVGIGYEKSIGDNSSISFKYDFDGQGSDYSINTISAKYILNF